MGVWIRNGSQPSTGVESVREPVQLLRENFIVGAEMYGGLGDRYNFGFHETSHYLAPVAAWNLPSGWTLRLSPGFGLNNNSSRFSLRWGVSREITGFGSMVVSCDWRQPVKIAKGFQRTNDQP